MANDIRKVKNQLTVLLWTCIAATAIVGLLFETNLILPGGLAGNVKAEYFTAVVLELVTLAVIPLALWLFKWKVVKKQMGKMPQKALLKWGTIRVLMLSLPLMAAVIAYFVFQKPSFGYIAIILTLSLFFVYPTMQRCMRDINVEKE